MTDDELAAIKARVLRFEPAIDLRATDAATYVARAKLTAMTFDARALLAEVERSREILKVVSAYGYDPGGPCAFCEKGILHATHCPVTQARALLAGDGGEAEVTP